MRAGNSGFNPTGGRLNGPERYRGRPGTWTSAADAKTDRQRDGAGVLVVQRQAQTASRSECGRGSASGQIKAGAEVGEPAGLDRRAYVGHQRLVIPEVV